MATLLAWTSTFFLIPALHALDHHDDDHIHLPNGAIVHVGHPHHHHHHDEVDEFVPAAAPPLWQEDHASAPAQVETFPFFPAHGAGGAAHFAAAVLLACGDVAFAKERASSGLDDQRDLSRLPRARFARTIPARGPPALLA